jgi:predicted MFS family arabinose efflux permease
LGIAGEICDKKAALSDSALVMILAAGGLISAADNWIVSPVLPAMAAGFGTSVSNAGFVLTAYLIPYGTMQPVYGFLSDRCGKATILKWIMCGLLLGTVGCAMAGSLWVLCLWRMITGFCAAGIIAVSLALIGDTVQPLERQAHVGKFMGIVFLGQGLSVGLGGVFAEYVSWRVAFVCFAGAASIIGLFYRKLPAGFTHPERRGFFFEVKRLAMTPKGLAIFPMSLATGFLLLGSYSYLGAFLHEAGGLSYLQVGLVVMFYGFACLFGGSQMGRIVRRLEHRVIIMAGGCFALVSNGILMFSHTWGMDLAATVSLGIGYIFIQSTLATIAFDVSDESKGLSSALIGLGLFGGGGLGAAFGGFLLQQWGYTSLWQTFAAGTLILVLAASRLRFD